jgi:hypothetical protein
MEPGWERLAGASIASDGTRLPSGRVGRSSEAALALPVAARLAVHAVDSIASGTSAVAFCQPLNLVFDIRTDLPSAIHRTLPLSGIPGITPSYTHNERAAPRLRTSSGVSLDEGCVTCKGLDSANVEGSGRMAG